MIKLRDQNDYFTGKIYFKYIDAQYAELVNYKNIQ